MGNIFKAFQNLLCETEPDYTLFRQQLRIQQQFLSGKDLICSNMIMRFCIALAYMEEMQTGPADILGLLRQIIRAYEQRVSIKVSLWQTMSNDSANFGLRAIEMPESNMIELMADAWQPIWLEKTDKIDDLSLRRSDEPAIGDGLLYAMSGGLFSSYQSEAQKVAVQECFFAPPGATLLITLPTGAGKSQCIQLPAWQESQGGRIKGGTTLVIVPTVSLALDQEERAKHLFSQSFGQEFTPSSLTGATSELARAAIYRGVEHGTLPILFTSPESLMTTSLYHICLEAARRGTINRLVIDEAHLVETWGAGFRTDFQFLATYRKKLLELSEGKLRTILLSATISTSCEKLLNRLFASNDAFYSIRADRLRPEISYWFDSSDTLLHRKEHVLEALCHLPRPTIIYVTSPNDTIQWLKILKEQGFYRVAAFSGKTHSDERLHLIKAWNENTYDIMIATSAFGVGVDKSDVRTIIHVCLPENINRFYQEVGRSGRDGYSANSLMCLTKEDYDQAKSMNRTARITTQKAIYRWKGMQQNHRPTDRSDIILVDTNATPSQNQDMRKGPSNREWNEHTLLLMQRANLIEITELRDNISEKELEDDIKQEDISDDISIWMQIRLLNPHITNYPDNPDFTSIFDVKRQKEIDAIHQALHNMQKIVSEYIGGQAKRCLAHSFLHVYSHSTTSCGGCPYCRKMHRTPYTGVLELEQKGDRYPRTVDAFPPQLTEIFGLRQRINVILNEPCTIADIQEIRAIFVQLIQMGFQQLIIPDRLIEDRVWSQALIHELAHHTKKPHVLLPTSWLTDKDEHPIYVVPSIVVYPLNEMEADYFHQAIHRLENTYLQHIPMLIIARRNLMLHSEHGTFANRINGLSYSLDHLRNRLQDPDELVF